MFWGSVCLAGFACAGFSAPYTTLPSTAPHVSIKGVARDCVRHVVGRDNYTYSFQFEPFAGSPLNISTNIDAPICWNDSQRGMDGRVYRIIYLDDPTRNLKNEAIRIEVIAGQNAGWHKSVDARPFGLWLALPFGFGLIIVGGVGAYRNRRSQPPEEPQGATHGPLKDSKSGFTDLKI